MKTTLTKTLLLFSLIGLAGCKKDKQKPVFYTLASGRSILVSNGNVLVSGFKSETQKFSTKYWINGESADQAKFTALVPNQSGYREAVDEQFRQVYTYKDANGALQNYQFDQGSLLKNGKIFYNKNNSLINMDTDSIGTVSQIAFHNGQSYFAGALGKVISSAPSDYLRPTTPFLWDGHSSMTLLPLPKQSFNFQGVSSLYLESANETYVGGLCNVPMYWKNTEPVVLDERYGEVWQITKSGSDVYAVGLVNKYNSNSTGHTACYWKNGQLHELEDRAQAYGIFVDGQDIYVTGATGNVPIDYRPCYWKNGVRVDLPM